ncbi:MAG TPA: class I SAM-dependent methyltransferase [Candidatus Baltobacteraceae bacterium]|jgi:2-polyprenyl-3-methyl-5-hydroxy-6-metoxy-1,4-benzoquinol methylase|nr:class I SAM-dependent methyltransferase [Candidatus Baltobacteraceae bacterium]
MEQPTYDNELGYWEARLGDEVPLNSVGYHGLSDAFVSFLYRLRRKRFLAAAAPLVKPQMRVLDIGSGGGFYIDLWQRLGVRDITATDLTQASIRAIERRFPGVHARTFDVGMGNMPFAPASFDAISCMDVVHHLMDDAAYEQAFRNCADLLRPGGAMIFTDNFLHGARYAGPHAVSRTLPEIQRAAAKAGLNIVTRKPIFVLMNNPVDSRSRLFKFYWRAMCFISSNYYAGAITGALLYPFEVVLTSLLREGPSTELAVAKKTSNP